MKTEITIEYRAGESVIYMAEAPEWMKWEMRTGKTIQQAGEIGMTDLLFLGYSAMKRSQAGQPVKPFEVWAETVSTVSMGNATNPKAISEEALADS